MLKDREPVRGDPQKARRFVTDKISGGDLLPIAGSQSRDSLAQWIELYKELHVVGAPERTVQAKTNDLARFLSFFRLDVGHERPDGWTPAISKAFLNSLQKTLSGKTGKPLASTSVNRIMATVRHFGRWLPQVRPLLAGDPLAGVRDIGTDEPAWRGLTDRQIMRLKAASEQRLKACTRGNQDPIKEMAVFHVLLYTGLRAFELVGLNIEQYHHRGFHEVRRKGKKESKKVAVPGDAREVLNRYLESRGNLDGEEPVFATRAGRRMTTRDVQNICQRIAGQANAQLKEEERFHLTPHMLRHTFLKRIADKEGVHVAQQASGNVSIREVFRYTKPSPQEMEEIVEDLF